MSTSRPTLPKVSSAMGVGLVALAVAVASFGAGALSRRGVTEREGTAVTVLPVKVADVRRVVVTSADGAVELTRQADGDWRGGPGVSPESASLMFTFEERLFPLSGYRTLPAAETAFGLEDPEITFSVEDKRGASQAIAFGAETFTGSGRYARRVGSEAPVYLVPRRMMDDLRSLLAGQRIDAENDLPTKIRELDQAAKEKADATDIGFWLQQSLDAGTPVPEGVK